MMTDIHKQRDTYEHILEGKHHIWPSFFFPRGETSENRQLHVFCFCFDRDQIANVLLNDWKEHLKIKKKKFNFVCYRRLFGWGAGSCLHFGIEKIRLLLTSK